MNDTFAPRGHRMGCTSHKQGENENNHVSKMRNREGERWEEKKKNLEEKYVSIKSHRGREREKSKTGQHDDHPLFSLLHHLCAILPLDGLKYTSCCPVDWSVRQCSETWNRRVMENGWERERRRRRAKARWPREGERKSKIQENGRLENSQNGMQVNRQMITLWLVRFIGKNRLEM